MTPTSDPFALWAERILRDQQQRLDHYDDLHTEHVTRMGRLDRHYEKLTELALALAQAHDRMETMIRSQQRSQILLHSLLEDIHMRMVQNEALASKVQLTLDAVLEMLRHRTGA